MTLRLFDLMGRQVLEQTNPSAGGVLEASLDVSTLKKDMYYLNYDNKTGETFNKR